MATSYTTNLGLALPVTGELAGTWGDVVNNSITSLLDSAIAGTTTLSSDADVTLTTTTGAANEARQAVLLFTGARTAIRTVTAPARTKTYVVINATTGGFDVKLVGAGPTTGVTIAAGEKCLVAWNSGDFVKVASSVADGVTSVAMTVPTGLSISGSPITSAGTLALTLTAGYSIPTTASQANWDSAYTQRLQWDGGSTNLVAATGRTSLGGTTAGQSFFTLTNPSAITFPRINADNTVSALNATDFRTAIGAGTGTGTVTSVGMTVPAFLSVSGSPVTGSGTLAVSYSGTALPVANGGTGATTLTANNVLLGNGTSALQVVAPGTSGNVLTSNGTTWASAALPAGGIQYVVKTANYTATDKQGVLADTSGGAFTVTLPATPATGAQVVVADSGNAWGTNNLTIGRNGSTISGLAEDLVCNITGASVQLVYDGSTWEIYAQIGGNGGTVVTLDGTQTLTNKTIAYSSNTLTGVVGTTATQTLTNKTIEAGTFTNGYTEEVATANTGTGYTIDLANGTVQILTLTGNCTFTFPAVTAGRSFMLLLKQDATGSRTVTWPSAVKWPGGTAPTITATASKLDKYVFTADGTNWYGSNAGQNYTV